jgi:hypothetical protein
MDANEIIKNEEIIEVTEENADIRSNNGAMIAAGIGLTVAVGGLAYKFIVKPVKAKIKRKLVEKITEAVVGCYNESFDVLEEEQEESQEVETEG